MSVALQAAVGNGVSRSLEDWLADIEAARAEAATAHATAVAAELAAAAAQTSAAQALAAIPPELTKRPETWGAVGNGVADDTLAVQQALNAIGEGGACELRPGAIYSVTNLTLPTFAGSWNKLGLFCRGGTAEIRARTAIDSLAATERWMASSPSKQYAGQPWRIHNVVFNANGLAQRALTLKTWGSELNGVQCIGAIGDFGAVITRRNQDGTLGTTDYLSENKAFHCLFRNNAGVQFGTQGPSTDNGAAVTDTTVHGCVAFNGAEGFWFPNCGGLQFHSNRTWALTQSAARFDRLSRGHSIRGNNFDGAPVKIGGQNGWDKLITIGGGNDYYVPLHILLSPNSAVEHVVIEDERFWRSQPGVQAYIECHTAQANKKIAPSNCKFATATPFRFAAGVADVGQYAPRNTYSADGGGWL